MKQLNEVMNDYMMIMNSGCKDTKIPENTHYPNYRKNEYVLMKTFHYRQVMKQAL